MRSKSALECAKDYLFQEFHRFKKKEIEMIYRSVTGTINPLKKFEIAQTIALKLAEDFQNKKIEFDNKYGSLDSDAFFDKYVRNKFQSLNLNPNYIKSFAYKICDIFQKLDKDTIMNSRQLRSNQEILENVWDSASNNFNHCLCAKLSSHPEKPLQQRCYKCLQVFHPECFWLKERDQVYQCPFCYLRNCIPQKQVKEIIFMGYLPKAKREKIQYKILFSPSDKFKTDKSIFYEARCVKFNSKNRFELSWPDCGSFSINKMKLHQFKPLQKNSPLKRRPDEPIRLEKSRFYPENQIVIEQRNFFDFNYREVQVQYHLVMIAVVKELQKESIVANLQKSLLPVDNSKMFLKSFFHETSEEIGIQQISISLLCQFFASRIKKPSRSVQCSTHFQVFDLDNFIVSSLSSKNATKRWKCPICDRRSYDLIIDQFVSSVMSKNMSSTQIKFNKQCQPIFIQANDLDELSEEQNQPIMQNDFKSKTNVNEPPQQKQCMVIDLQSENEVVPAQQVQAHSEMIDSTVEAANNSKKGKQQEEENRKQKERKEPFQIVQQQPIVEENNEIEPPKRQRKYESSKGSGQNVRKMKPSEASSLQPALKDKEVNLVDILSSDQEQIDANLPEIQVQFGHQFSKKSSNKEPDINSNISEEKQKKKNTEKPSSKQKSAETTLNKKKSIQKKDKQSNNKSKIVLFNQPVDVITILSDEEEEQIKNQDAKKLRDLYEKLQHAHKLVNFQSGDSNTMISEEDTEIFETIYEKIMKIVQD